MCVDTSYCNRNTNKRLTEQRLIGKTDNFPVSLDNKIIQCTRVEKPKIKKIVIPLVQN